MSLSKALKGHSSLSPRKENLKSVKKWVGFLQAISNDFVSLQEPDDTNRAAEGSGSITQAYHEEQSTSLTQSPGSQS